MTSGLSFFQKIKLLSHVIPLSINYRSKRSKNIWLFGAWAGEKYSDNSRTVFEYILKEKNKKVFWIAKNKNVYHNLNNKGMPVLFSKSIKGIYYQLKAGVVFYCVGVGDLNSRLLSGAVHINLWHGVGGGKKIGHDAGWYNKLYDRCLYDLQKKYYPKTYYVCTSEEMKKVFESAFDVDDEHIIMAGQPRNDMFFDSDYVFTTIDPKQFDGKKVITYMPTHRLEGKKQMNCSELFKLKELDEFCERNDCLFVIKKHFYHKNEIEDVSVYHNIIDMTNVQSIDTNELLMISDYLISDYSSVTADYLLLNKPIFYYCFDLEDYLSNDRDMYWSYEDITPGSKSRNFDELLSSLSKVIEDETDDYIEERARVLDMFYGKQARKAVSEDIIKAVEEITSEK